jgi:hypothetical protein
MRFTDALRVFFAFPCNNKAKKPLEHALLPEWRKGVEQVRG